MKKYLILITIFFVSFTGVHAEFGDREEYQADPCGADMQKWILCTIGKKLGVDLTKFTISDFNVGSNGHAATYNYNLKDSLGNIFGLSYCANGWYTYTTNVVCESAANSCGMTNPGLKSTSKNYDARGGLSAVTEGACTAVKPPDTSCCPNGGINAPSCNLCPSGSVMSPLPFNIGTSKCSCPNGASPASGCRVCPTNQLMYNGFCGCANGANNPPACNTCPTGAAMTNGSCVCGNGAEALSNCTVCPTGKIMDGNQCVKSCPLTNVCGITSQGVERNGVCQTLDGSNANASCIADFHVTSDTVNPNGSVEFSWSLKNLPTNIRSKCGFVDLTTGTQRPIPGLQDLDPVANRVRINNVQSTTRFCLICKFYKVANNTFGDSLGDAAVHQWVRVIRVGEQ